MIEGKERDDFEIGDAEDNLPGGFGFGKAGFDKPALVMEAMRNCIAASNCEMKQGYWIRKSDKHGNVNEIYIEDGRKKFCSCVEVLGELLAPDLDKDAKDNVQGLFKSIETKRKEFANGEIEIWKNMPNESRKQMASQGIFFMKEFITIPLNKELMTEFQLEVYKGIFTELNLLLSRIKYFKKKAKFG